MKKETCKSELKLREKLQRRFAPTPAAISGISGRNAAERVAGLSGIRRENTRQQIRRLEQYVWSSLSGYLHSNAKQSWVSYDTVLSYVGGSRKRYGEFVA